MKETHAPATVWQAWFDGCSLSNPGPSGIGAVLRDANGGRLEVCAGIGHATNNVAEYRALIAVMALALEHGCRELVVRGDSQLVINQVFNGWKVSAAGLQPLHAQSRALCAKFARVQGQWIPREQNGEADELSKRGAQQQPVVVESASQPAPADADDWQAWFDGCAIRNPGPAGAGAVLVDPQGKRYPLSRGLGHATNNEAEYNALIDVLDLAIELGCSRLTVRGDSQLVINQVFSGWKVSAANLQPLNHTARSLVARMGRCRGQWIPREENGEADALSKQAAQMPATARRGMGARP